ncbi:MAG: PAS domain S-box protein [Nitrospirota bacterium]
MKPKKPRTSKPYTSFPVVGIDASAINRVEEIAHLGSWELDLAQNKLTWSDEVYRIFGLQPQEFGATYEAFLERIHPGDRAAVDTAYSASLREEKDTYEIEHRVVRKSDGEIRIVHEKCEHVRDRDGKIIRSIGMVHDITERKRTEKALLNSEQRLKAVLYGSPIPQFVIDRDHKVVYWNNALEVITGIQATEIIGTNQHWRAFYSAERPCLADLLIDEAIERIPVLYQEKHSRSKLVADAYEVTDYFPALGEQGKWLYFTAAAIRDINGQITSVLETLEDITVRKQAEEQILLDIENLRASNEEMERLNQAMVGRELRMIELKKEINELCTRAGEAQRYNLNFESEEQL